jgi:hypothetical protein
MPNPPPPKSKVDEYIEKLAADPSKTGILTEGDSWFALPLPHRPNIVSMLIEKFNGKAAWLRLEDSGDEARIMEAGEQWEKLHKVLTKPKARFDIIMFSAGGNDIVGRCLFPLLRQRDWPVQSRAMDEALLGAEKHHGRERPTPDHLVPARTLRPNAAKNGAELRPVLPRPNTGDAHEG